MRLCLNRRSSGTRGRRRAIWIWILLNKETGVYIEGENLLVVTIPRLVVSRETQRPRRRRLIAAQTAATSWRYYPTLMRGNAIDGMAMIRGLFEFHLGIRLTVVVSNIRWLWTTTHRPSVSIYKGSSGIRNRATKWMFNMGKECQYWTCILHLCGYICRMFLQHRMQQLLQHQTLQYGTERTREFGCIVSVSNKQQFLLEQMGEGAAARHSSL